MPVAPIQGVADACRSAQVRERGLLAPTTHPVWGESLLAPQPVRFSGALPNAVRAAPALGEHTEAVLTALLGIDAAALARLRAEAAV